MSYMVDKSPVEDKLLNAGVRPWEPKEHRPVLTASRSAYKPYSTYVGCQSAKDCYEGMLSITNTEQRQEQVHPLAAQVRTPVEQLRLIASCCHRCPRYTKALGNLLCYVNIVWFREHVKIMLRRDFVTASAHSPRSVAILRYSVSSPLISRIQNRMLGLLRRACLLYTVCSGLVTQISHALIGRWNNTRIPIEALVERLGCGVHGECVVRAWVGGSSRTCEPRGHIAIIEHLQLNLSTTSEKIQTR